MEGALTAPACQPRLPPAQLPGGRRLVCDTSGVTRVTDDAPAGQGASISEADELLLAQRLISYDTSRSEGLRSAAEFIKGWLEGYRIAFREYEVNGLPAIVAAVGDGPSTVIWSSHMDVVPGRREQFSPWRVGDRLYGRGAYDMKGALAAMLAALADLAAARQTIPGVKAKLLIVPDEEAEVELAGGKASAFLADEGHLGEFAICGEPTDMQIGVQAKGVLVLQVDVEGRAAHGSTPWLGENAILKAVRLYEQIFELPFCHESSEMFDRPSVNLGMISGGDVVNKVPDLCHMDVGIRYLPTQDPDEVLRQVRSLDAEVNPSYHLPPATLDPRNPYVQTLRRALSNGAQGQALVVGRDGASDAVHFLDRGIPSVEFGPAGGGHHGPGEHVDVLSLRRYRHVLARFLQLLAADRAS
jgi:succinyl-diaminopimelate desuccinylase